MITDSVRLALVFWSRLFNWRSVLVIVQPATLVGCDRNAFRRFWKWKSRPGRPRLPQNLHQLIARMVQENPTWGEERIADELWLKLGLQVSPRTICAYWPDVPPTPRRGRSQAWSTFVRKHAQALLACDFMVAITVRLRILTLGIEALRTPVRTPQANAFCERLIGTIRRECLDFMIPLSHRHLRQTLRLVGDTLQPRTTTLSLRTGYSRPDCSAAPKRTTTSATSR